MAIHRFQFSIPYFTGIPSDVIVNDWHLSWPLGSPSDTDFENLRDALVTFYDLCYSPAGVDNMAPWMNPAGAILKVYNIQDPIPRAPVYLSAAPLTDNRVSTGTCALETAICLSFQGDPLSGVPQARRRGRVFLGGWAQPTYRGDNNEFPTVDPNLVNAIVGAAEGFATDSAAAGWAWIVYSRVNGTGAPVTNGWVDNALDTQRRREVGATIRTTFP